MSNDEEEPDASGPPPEMLVAMDIEDTLRAAGIDVVGIAGRVGEALGILTEPSAVDAVVMDLNLAGETGVPIADRLLAEGKPFVVLTGYGGTGLPDRHKGARVLTKPFHPATLVAALAKAMAKG